MQKEEKSKIRSGNADGNAQTGPLCTRLCGQILGRAKLGNKLCWSRNECAFHPNPRGRSPYLLKAARWRDSESVEGLLGVMRRSI